ncbi:ABC transporter ATP-binding protein [Isoptericola hypogeus]|uniref:ABC transporter ATP-binding protein n=1 Tax=Isoptericola hypogeus TaxID=300179 RepID=A0ABP4VMW2_9MICO
MSADTPERPGRRVRPGRSGARRPGTAVRALRARLDSLVRPRAEGTGLIADAPTVPFRDVLRRLRPELSGRGPVLTLLVLLTVAVAGIETVEIWLFQRVVDDVLVPVDVSPLLAIAGLYVALALLSGLLSWVDEVASAWLSEHVSLDLRRRVLAHLHKVPSDVADQQRAGDVLTRLTRDVRSVETLLLGAVDGAGALARLLLYGGAMMLLDWQLALVAFVVAPLFWWASDRFARRFKKVAKEKRRRTGSMTAVAEESLAALSLVQVHGREREEQEKFEREGRAVVAAELGAARLRATYPIVVDLLELAGLLAVIGLGIWALAEGRLTLGGLLVFLTYLSQLVRPMRELGDLVVSVASAVAGTERVLEVLDLPTGLAEPADPVALDDVEGRVRVNDASFTYHGAAAPALTGVNLTLVPGRMVALAGASGSGKSTLVRLLGRLSDTPTGSVTLDGVDLRDLRLQTVRENITVLLQEAPVLDASVRDNVTFSRPGATDDEVWEALAMAGLDDAVRALPAGLDARLGQRGRSLSGGQRQRIALARALLVDSRVLVLDEPTTGLDAAAAQRLLATLRRLADDRSVVVASHDPAVLAEADEVVTIERGTVVPSPASSPDASPDPSPAGSAAAAPGGAQGAGSTTGVAR